LFWGWVKSVTKCFFHASHSSTYCVSASQSTCKAVLKDGVSDPVFR
jgi:hypothetical protein